MRVMAAVSLGAEEDFRPVAERGAQRVHSPEIVQSRIQLNDRDQSRLHLYSNDGCAQRRRQTRYIAGMCPDIDNQIAVPDGSLQIVDQLWLMQHSGRHDLVHEHSHCRIVVRKAQRQTIAKIDRPGALGSRKHTPTNFASR